MSHYSGKFVLRLPCEVHQKLAKRALEERVSLNQLCVGLISEGIEGRGARRPWDKWGGQLLNMLKVRFGGHLIGLVLFGSQVRGEATESSDIDVLIVLDSHVALKRSLYSWWDSRVRFPGTVVVNPHFVHLPKNWRDAGGLWFEVFLNHEIIYQKQNRLSNFFEKVMVAIQKGLIARQESHGHPYWIWRTSEK